VFNLDHAITHDLDSVAPIRTRPSPAQSNTTIDTTDQDTPPSVSCFFPSTRGVVEFVAHNDSTVLLAATGHIRSFIAQRLNEDGEQSTKADLSPITRTVRAYPTGSAFESDWIVLEKARQVDRGLYSKLQEQNRRYLIVLNTGTGFGSWRVVDTLWQPQQQPQGQQNLDKVSLVINEQVNEQSDKQINKQINEQGDELIVGPFASKKSAVAFGETLDDVFELCRYPKELALAPNGTACAYKEMGRCPAACDGSESMESYLNRLREAAKTASQGIRAWKEQLSKAIATASASLDFETAQITQRQLQQVEDLSTDAGAYAASLHAMSCLCISPSIRKGWATIWKFNSAGLVPVMSISGNWDQSDLDIQAWALGSHDDRQPHASGSTPLCVMNEQWLSQLALIFRHWMTKASRSKRRRVTFIDLREQVRPADPVSLLKKSIQEACTAVDLGHEDGEHTHIVI
jgi:hypothetical protein